MHAVVTLTRAKPRLTENNGLHLELFEYIYIFVLSLTGNRFGFFVCSYDPETDRWNTLCPMKTARSLAGCAMYGGQVYVIGEDNFGILAHLIHFY